MASKWQVDKETSKAKPNETEFEKVKRLRKRVAWNLDINEEEKNLLNKYESKKTKESFVSESDYAERVWDAAVKGFNYPEMDPIYNIAKNPLPYMDDMLNALEHTNFFENRATEYSRAATKGTWEEAFI